MRILLPALASACLIAVACVDSADGFSDSELAASTATPPGQAPSGPGGADYLFGNVATTYHAQANDELSYWTLEPRTWAGPGAPPSELPMVVFLHGYGGNDPFWYQAWLTHLVRKGNLVVFPKFQNAWTWDQLYAGNAAWSVHDAVGVLARSAIPPSSSYGMTIIGHSVGGVVAVDLANRWAAGLPAPRAILLAMPLGNPFTMDSLASIPPFVALDCVVADQDTIAGRAGCDLVWQRTAHMALRDYVWMHSDAHGTPALVASHFTPNITDALAMRGLWKLADGLRDCTAYGASCSYALGAGPDQVSLGSWSDGTPVAPLSVSITPP